MPVDWVPGASTVVVAPRPHLALLCHHGSVGVARGDLLHRLFLQRFHQLELVDGTTQRPGWTRHEDVASSSDWCEAAWSVL